jgi:glycosyltransferase involved in cell wall biosynthesis
MLISIIFLGVYWRTRNLINKFQNYFYHRKNSYKAWIKQNEHEQKESELAYQPKISIIVPVYNTPKKWLELCILSVLNQTYPNWELCLFDNGSNAETGRVLIEYAKKDQRIKVGRSEKNLNIVGGSNGAIKMATGEFISLLDSDDELAPFALYEVVKTLNSNRRLDFIYSDEDKIDQAGNRFAPFFKPDINPDLLLSMNYISHLGTYRKSIIDKIAGFRRGYDGAQDYDLLLRFLEKTKKERVHHIPKILYHWRVIPGSTAAGHGEKDYAAVAAKKAIADYLKRNNISGQVIDGLAPGAYRVKRNILGNPLISIIIPFQDGAELTKKCLNSIKKSNYENYEVILVRHGRQKKETDRYLKTLKDAKVRIYDCYQEWDKEFNHSALNNLAVNEAKGEYLLLLNNDVEIITPACWILLSS